MLSSLIKRIQKTVAGKPAIDGDQLDELAAVNLNSLDIKNEQTDPKPVEPAKPAEVAAPIKEEPQPLKLEPKPVEQPKPKAEAVLVVSDRQKKADLLISEAKKWVGVREKGGANKGAEVEKFQKAIDGKASGEAWCCAFVWFCILESEKNYKLRFGQNISSWLFKTEHCLTFWNLSPKESKLQTPEPGALIIWQHLTDKGEQTSHGHVGVVIRVIDKTFIETVEGNTSSDSLVQDEGDGVYLLKRNYRQQTGTKRVVGFLFPWKD